MRVVIADDSVLLREGVSRLLGEAGFEVVGQAADADELMVEVAVKNPDVAIVDIRMPPGYKDDGLRAAIRLRSLHPNLGVLVLSQYVRPSYASDLDELSDAVQRVGEGGSVLDPSVVAQLVGRHRPHDDPIDDLTDREREVLALMAEGRSNRAIGDRLFITNRTVEKHVKSIFTKLKLSATESDHRRVLAVLAYLGS
jgi:DNA-binding NarL/FixJ family response regulator